MSQQIENQLQAGLAHHQSGRLQQAEAEYRSVLRLQPQHPQASYLMSVLALQIGNAAAAVPFIEAAISGAPEDPEFHNIRGEVYLALRRFDEAISSYRRAIELNPAHAGAHNNLGNALRERGELRSAAQHYRQAIAIAPDFVLSHNNLGIVTRQLGDPAASVAHFERALELVPEYVEARTNLGNALLAMGRVDEAVAAQRQAVEIRPDYAEAHSNLGNALKVAGRLEQAIECYRRAVELAPGFAMGHYNLGTALDENGAPADAVDSYRKALELDPGYADAHNNLGNALDELGQHDEAAAHYQRAIELRPGYAEAHRNLSRIRPDPAHAPQIEQLLKQSELTADDLMHLRSALGNIRQKEQRFDDAFIHASAANALKRETLHYDAGAHSAAVDRLISVFSADYFQQQDDSGCDSEVPVFILGMPRSGTSLVEQIVSSHPRVHGAGELPTLGRFEETIDSASSTPYPQCMSTPDRVLMRRLAQQYLDELRGYDADAIRITDKMPSNFLRIGLIATLFPRARIIHCQRSALDTCTSNYLHFFASGNEYSFNLDDLGRFYLDYRRLMDHWSRVVPTPMLTVQYEALVDDQETQSRRMIDYLGLDWDARCLSFHENRRAVNNFSSQQVRQPIYRRSIERWRRYESHLQPLVQLFERQDPPVR